MRSSGDRFEIFKEDGRWHWELHKSHAPSSPQARSWGKGYPSPSAAERSIRSACDAAIAACGLYGETVSGRPKPRIIVRPA
jgi:hypothetical protein